MDPLKMFFLLNKGIFHCYVSLPEGIIFLFDRLSAQSKKKTGLGAKPEAPQIHGGRGRFRRGFRRNEVLWTKALTYALKIDGLQCPKFYPRSI